MKQMINEACLIEFEHNMDEGKDDLTIKKGSSLASKELKLTIMKIMRKRVGIETSWSEIIAEIKKMEKKEKKKLQKEVKEKEREYLAQEIMRLKTWNNKLLSKQRSYPEFERRVKREVVCFACKKSGHIQRNCPELSKVGDNYPF